MVVSNHRSWADVFVLQQALRGRVPLLKFFLKRELLYVPVIGLAWWALDFPFVSRKSGEAGRRDLEAVRSACERFLVLPTAVLNFLEGTRYTPQKAAAQRSPYRHLLKPRAGGLATVLAVMGARLDAVLDVTIAYPAGTPTFWDLLCGRMREVAVRVRRLPVPPGLAPPAPGADAGRYAVRVQAWLREIWHEKDRAIAALDKGGKAPPP